MSLSSFPDFRTCLLHLQDLDRVIRRTTMEASKIETQPTENLTHVSKSTSINVHMRYRTAAET